MNTLPLQTKFSVTSGTSREPCRTFPWGNAVETFAVGSQGDWRIFGDGVLGVHFYLRFDGRMAHIAPASPDARVVVKGEILDQKWHPVPVLSHVEFGSARLYVVCEERAAVSPSPQGSSVPVMPRVLFQPQPVVTERLDRTRRISTPAPASPGPAAPDLAVRQEHRVRVITAAPDLAVRQEHRVAVITRHDPTPAPLVRTETRHELPPAAASPGEHVRVPIVRHESAPVPVSRRSTDPNVARSLDSEWSTMIDGGALREYARRVADASADSARAHAQAYASEVRARRSSSSPPTAMDSPLQGATRQAVRDELPGRKERAPDRRGAAATYASREHTPGQSDAPVVRSNAPRPTDAPRADERAMMQGGPSHAPEELDSRASAPPPSSRSRLVQAWRETSNVKKLVALMLPLLGWTVLQEPEITTRPVSVEMSRAPGAIPGTRAAKAGATRKSVTTIATPPSPVRVGAVHQTLPTPPGAPPAASAEAMPHAPPTRAPETTPEKPATATATFVAAAAGPSPVSGLGSSPAERGALDALFEGKLAAASALYASLAGEHPTSPVYGLAARMVREKAVRKP